MRKVIVISLLFMLSCSKPEKISKCQSFSGPLTSTAEIDMGYCNGTSPPRNNVEAIYGYTKTCY